MQENNLGNVQCNNAPDVNDGSRTSGHYQPTNDIVKNRGESNTCC